MRALKILLVNPPLSGRSVAEERHGLPGMKNLFRGEPFPLEVLAGNLLEHEIRILDLKVEEVTVFPEVLASFAPDLVGFTAVTCEAPTALRLSREVRQAGSAVVVVGGIHASCDPEYFNRDSVDFVAVGLGKASFAELVGELGEARRTPQIPGIAKTRPGKRLCLAPRALTESDLVDDRPPRFDLVAHYRQHYTVERLGLEMGLVATAMGCPFSCSFCCIPNLTGPRYLCHSVEAVVRDVRLLGDIPVVRFVDANTFGHPRRSRELCEALARADLGKQLVVEARADEVARHPELFRALQAVGLRAVVIGFEEFRSPQLRRLKPGMSATANDQAIEILHHLGVTLVGTFIVSPDYLDDDFDGLDRYIEDRAIDLTILTVLTPLPGTPLHRSLREQIVLTDPEYYTLQNAVVPTRLEERRFYERLTASQHRCLERARI